MSIYMIKSLLSIIFILAAFTAAISMFSLMGRLEKKANPAVLRKIHKTAGIIFAIFLLVLSYLCLSIVAKAGDQLSTRAVLHSILSLILLIIFIIKVLFVRFYKQFLRLVPGLGIAVLMLAFVVFMSSAGYFFLRAATVPHGSQDNSRSVQTFAGDQPQKGASLFQNLCSGCHFSDRETAKVGPGLKGVLKKDKLPASQRPATLENIRKQLLSPYLAMPSFANLSSQDLADLLAYLATL